MDFKEEWNWLNSYQMEAVTDENDACIVNANVGSGKTTVLIAKILYLHYEKKIPLEKMVVLTFTNKAAGEIIERLKKKEPELTITPVGEPDFILTYKKESTPGTLFRWLKVILVCLATFFGAAFSIMTFNTDVDVGTLFQKIYFQVTGKISSGFTILEISYSIGLAIGVLFFFNHFSHLKFSADPTPMQVQMRKYEDDVNTTILEDLNREK